MSDVEEKAKKSVEEFKETRKEKKERIKSEIVDYIDRNSHRHPFRTGSVWRKYVVRYVVKNFDITEPTVINYLDELVQEGRIVSVDVIEDDPSKQRKRHVYYDLKFTIPIFATKLFMAMVVPLVAGFFLGLDLEELGFTEGSVLFGIVISEIF